jgi:hypothetical protein
MWLRLQLETVVMKGRPRQMHFPLPPLPTSAVVFFAGGGLAEQHVILNCILNSPTLNAASAVNLGAA